MLEQLVFRYGERGDHTIFHSECFWYFSTLWLRRCERHFFSAKSLTLVNIYYVRCTKKFLYFFHTFTLQIPA